MFLYSDSDLYLKKGKYLEQTALTAIFEVTWEDLRGGELILTLMIDIYYGQLKDSALLNSSELQYPHIMYWLLTAMLHRLLIIVLLKYIKTGRHSDKALYC